MNILYGSEFKTMLPKLKSDNFKGLELIRPLYLVEEDIIEKWRDTYGLEFIHCACPISDYKIARHDENLSKRDEVKKLIKSLKKTNKNVELRIFKSAENVNLDAIIEWKKDGKKHNYLDEYQKIRRIKKLKELKKEKRVLTFVICAYNEERNLHRLFENLVNQENQNFNIIFVNDGSTDNTLQIAKEYMIKNENCIVISKKNTGLSDSRNMGTKYVKTPYFMYLDADDFLDRDAVDIIITKIKSAEKKLDILKINVKSVSEEEVIVERNKSVELQEVKGTEAITALGFVDKLYMLPTVYVFRTEYFRNNNFSFEYGRYHEDYGLIPFTVLLADNVTTTQETLYNYVLSKNSITRIKDNRKAIKKAEDTLYFYKQSMFAIDELKKNNNDGRITKDVYKKFKRLYTIGLIEKMKEMYVILQTEKNEEIVKEIKSFFENIKKEKIYKNIAGFELKDIIKRNLIKYNMMLYLKKAVEKDKENKE